MQSYFISRNPPKEFYHLFSFACDQRANSSFNDEYSTKQDIHKEIKLRKTYEKKVRPKNI